MSNTEKLVLLIVKLSELDEFEKLFIIIIIIIVLAHELQFTLKLQKHNNTFTYLHVTIYML